MAGTDRAPLTFTEALEVIRSTEFETPPGEPPPHSYYRELFGPPSSQRDASERRRLRFASDLLEFSRVDPAAKRILDVGSGFGVTLLALALMGAEQACGVDVVPYKSDYVNTWRQSLPSGLADRIVARCGSAADLPFADESFDVLLAVEAVQHFIDPQPFFAEAYRVLRPGGTLIISDGCNALNVAQRRWCRQVWESHERDEALAPERTVFQFVRKREQIAREAFAELTAEEARMIALETAGMVSDEVIAATGRYLETGQRPGRRYTRGQVSVHPTQHMIMEGLVNPVWLYRSLRGAGFQVRLRGHWGGAGGNPVYRAANRVLGALTPVTIFTARAIRAAAVKPA